LIAIFKSKVTERKGQKEIKLVIPEDSKYMVLRRNQPTTQKK
jgi:hypothetical protein